MFLLRSALLLLLLLSYTGADFLQGSIGSSSRFVDNAMDSACEWAVGASEYSQASSGSSGSQPDFKYDLSGWKLELLLDSPVYEAERVFRDLDSAIPPLRKLQHSGVRVTIREPRLDDQVWLIHKGDGYGSDSDTVVVAARHMIGPWRVEKSKNFNGRKTVRQLRDAGGAVYCVASDNCHHASERMFNL